MIQQQLIRFYTQQQHGPSEIDAADDGVVVL